MPTIPPSPVRRALKRQAYKDTTKHSSNEEFPADVIGKSCKHKAASLCCSCTWTGCENCPRRWPEFQDTRAAAGQEGGTGQ